MGELARTRPKPEADVSNVVIEDGVHGEVFIIDYFFDGPGFLEKIILLEPFWNIKTYPRNRPLLKFRFIASFM